MLKKFGYTNIMVLILGLLIIVTFVDFNNLEVIDYVILSLFGTTVLIHLVRIGLLLTKGRD